MRQLTLAFAILGFLFGLMATAGAQCALPHQLTNGQAADATQVMANFNALVNCLQSAPAGSANSVQVNAGNGAFGAVGPLNDGELVVGASGNAPVATSLTAGAGIAITNGPGEIAISATGVSAQREFGPFLPPSASLFTFIDGPASIVPTVTDVAEVGLVYSVPVTNNTAAFPGAYLNVPATTPWTLTFRARYSAMMGDFPEFGVWIKDSAGKMLGTVMESRSGVANIVVKRCNSNTSLNTNPYVFAVSDAPSWFRVSYDGTNIRFSVSWDGQNWLISWSETSTTFLNGTLQYVGIGGISGISNTNIWRAGSTTGAVITYWDLDS